MLFIFNCFQTTVRLVPTNRSAIHYQIDKILTFSTLHNTQRLVHYQSDNQFIKSIAGNTIKQGHANADSGNNHELTETGERGRLTIHFRRINRQLRIQGDKYLMRKGQKKGIHL